MGPSLPHLFKPAGIRTSAKPVDLSSDPEERLALGGIRGLEVHACLWSKAMSLVVVGVVSLSSGGVSLAIRTKLCKVPCSMGGPKFSAETGRGSLPFPCFSQSFSKYAVTTHWPTDLFPPQKGLTRSFLGCLFPSTRCLAGRKLLRQDRMSRWLCVDC